MNRPTQPLFAGFLLVAIIILAGLLTSCGTGHPRATIETVAMTDASQPPELFQRIETVVLGNGMTFLLLPRHEVPMVSGRILVRVGNVDNPEGATGLAHMFEHMAFKGTDAIGVIDAEAERALLATIMLKGDELTEALRRGVDPEQIESLRPCLCGATCCCHLGWMLNGLSVPRPSGSRIFRASTTTRGA